MTLEKGQKYDIEEMRARFSGWKCGEEYISTEGYNVQCYFAGEAACPYEVAMGEEERVDDAEARRRGDREEFSSLLALELTGERYPTIGELYAEAYGKAVL